MKVFDFEASIDNLCYLNYMEQQEIKVNVELKNNFVIEEATQEENEQEKNINHKT